MVTAQNAKLLTSYREEIKSNRLDQKYKYAIEGIEKEILVTDVCVGDVVLINDETTKIAADIRIFDNKDLSVNNSTITGESKIIKFTDKCEPEGYSNSLYSKNIVLNVWFHLAKLN